MIHLGNFSSLFSIEGQGLNQLSQIEKSQQKDDVSLFFNLDNKFSSYIYFQVQTI